MTICAIVPTFSHVDVYSLKKIETKNGYLSMWDINGWKRHLIN